MAWSIGAPDGKQFAPSTWTFRVNDRFEDLQTEPSLDGREYARAVVQHFHFPEWGL